MVCAIYCRLSREDEEKEKGISESIQNQRSMLVGYAAKEDWEVYDVYVDEDFSGADADRPEFNRMLRDAKKGRFQIVLCKTQSRFTRDMELVERYLHHLFPLWGIRFVSIVDGVDTVQKYNKKSRQINGLVNEWYLEDLSENIRAVLDNKREEGKFIGSFAPFGYQKMRTDHNRLEIDPYAAAVVREIFSLSLQGYGRQKIATLLNELGQLSPSDYKRMQGEDPLAQGERMSRWSAATIGRMLRNEVYIGTMVQGIKQKPSYKSKVTRQQPRSAWTRVEGTHEPIIDPETFREVQKRLDGRARSSKTGQPHPLAGLVFCADCGAGMVKSSVSYRGNRRSYLRCSNYAQDSRACQSHAVRLDQLIDLIAGRLQEHLINLSGKFPSDSWSNKRTLSRQEPIRQRVHELEKQKSLRLRACNRLYLDYVGGLFDRRQFMQMQESYTRQLEMLSQQIELLKGQLVAEESASPTGIPKLEQGLTRALAMQYIRRVEIGIYDKEKKSQAVRVFWRF